MPKEEQTQPIKDIMNEDKKDIPDWVNTGVAFLKNDPPQPQRTYTEEEVRPLVEALESISYNRDPRCNWCKEEAEKVLDKFKSNNQVNK